MNVFADHLRWPSGTSRLHVGSAQDQPEQVEGEGLNAEVLDAEMGPWQGALLSASIMLHYNTQIDYIIYIYFILQYLIYMYTYIFVCALMTDHSA